jgi:long-chain acyl-CoA synthetase
MSEQHTSQSTQAASPSRRKDAPWLFFYDEGVRHSLEYPDIPLYYWLDQAAEHNPGAPACTWRNTTITYARLRKAAETVAANLRAGGVGPGDTVGIMLPNLPQTMIAFWGVLKAGAVVVMINPLYMEKELLHQLRDANIRHLVSYDACWPKFAALRDKVAVERCYLTTVDEGLSFPLNLLRRFKKERTVDVPYDGATVLPFSSLLKGRRRLSEPVDNPRKTLALLQYTGGTTGLSKGAMLTHYNVAANILQMGELLQNLRGSPQTFMGVLPFFHVYGLHTCLVLPTFFQANVAPLLRFSPRELLRALKKYKATILPGAPAMYIALLQQKQAERVRLEHLKICVCGSAPMPLESIRRFEEVFGARIMEGYGLSEASPITHMTPAGGLRKVGSIGLPLPDTEARIVDMELGGVTLPPGKVGELALRGPQVMSGYWNNPDETAGALRNGWLYSGDIAYMDEDGFFYIVDRKKDMVIVGGYNVAPREIDEVLHEHPKVREAVSVGVPHASRGEVIKAYVVLKEGEQCGQAEILRWCRERLANYKVPRTVEFRDSLPKTMVGKILRRVLRAEEEEKLRKSSGTEEAAEA